MVWKNISWCSAVHLMESHFSQRVNMARHSSGTTDLVFCSILQDFPDKLCIYIFLSASTVTQWKKWWCIPHVVCRTWTLLGVLLQQAWRTHGGNEVDLFQVPRWLADKHRHINPSRAGCFGKSPGAWDLRAGPCEGHQVTCCRQRRMWDSSTWLLFCHRFCWLITPGPVVRPRHAAARRLSDRWPPCWLH